MAKHPHRLILQQKRTWRCTFQGCSFFVHLGLAHVLIGKTGICWECNEEYIIDEDALTEEMPRCAECRTKTLLSSTPVEKKEDVINQDDVMTPEQRAMYKSLGLLK